MPISQGVNLDGTSSTVVVGESNGAQQVPVRDVLNISGISAIVTVGTTSIEAKAGATHLTNRKLLEVTPTNGTVFYSFTSPATASLTPVFKNQTKSFSFTENVPVFIIAAVAGVTVVINEAG